ncbi:site-specific integrase [Limosilactobacillus fermentum]|uniref:site-specific integrase n=1 Tax=Limosilactobacillus fermentum TaxID=1613 RepID=UPI000E095981|nr:site-specific integrase [Limosilactobacillus fermentum]RDG21440.1 site-specific integrase [Limosilactobacillus fermentum]
MAQIIKKGPSWMVRVTWRDEDGKQHKKSKSGFKTKAAARKAGAEMENTKYRGGLGTDNPIFADYYLAWYETFKEAKSARATRDFYTYCTHVVNDYFGRAKIQSITRTKYQQFINAFGKERSKHTVTKVNAYIKVAVKSAVMDKIIPADFTEGVELVWDDKRSRHVEYLNMEEIERLTTLVEKRLSPGFPVRYMILTAIYTGMRLSEIAALTWDDLNLPFKTIEISKSWDFKGRTFKDTKTKSSRRIIRVNQELLDCLVELKANGHDLVFARKDGSICGSSSANRTLRLFLDKLNLDKPGFHFHSLRHSHVAYLLANGVPLYAISKRLGHSNMTTTANRYAYLIDEFKARSDDQIERALVSLGVPDGVPTSLFL